jgi:hypothetical protein
MACRLSLALGKRSCVERTERFRTSERAFCPASQPEVGLIDIMAVSSVAVTVASVRATKTLFVDGVYG